MQGHAEGLEARSPEPRRVPCGAPSPSIPPRALQPGGAARTLRTDREGMAGGPGPPYLDDCRAGGCGGGVRLRLRASRRPPTPGSQRRLLPPQARQAGPVGGARARHKPRPRSPRVRGATTASSRPSPRSAPPGAGLGARTRAQNGRAPRRALATVTGAACPARPNRSWGQSHSPAFTSRRSLAEWLGTRDSTSRSLKFLPW